MNATALKESTHWLAYFKQNAPRVFRPPHEAFRLSPEERARIESSIQKFQIGEASEGKHLKKRAEQFARRAGDPDYARAIEYLIREENRHSVYLAGFMRAQEIPCAAHTWTDGIFRAIRRVFGLEASIRILVTAELIALIYYRCLAKATGSRNLANICARMLAEEEQHVLFQMTTIHRLNNAKFPLFGALADIAHAGLMFLTTLVVWIEHRRVLKVEYGFRAYFRAVWDRFQENMDAGYTAATGSEEPQVRGIACR